MQMTYSMVKNPYWWEADKSAIYKRGRGVELARSSKKKLQLSGQSGNWTCVSGFKIHSTGQTGKKSIRKLELRTDLLILYRWWLHYWVRVFYAGSHKKSAQLISYTLSICFEGSLVMLFLYNLMFLFGLVVFVYYVHISWAFHWNCIPFGVIWIRIRDKTSVWIMVHQKEPMMRGVNRTSDRWIWP